MNKTRQQFTQTSLIQMIRGVFKQAFPNEPMVVNSIMSALAMFGLKMPSLLQFDRFMRHEKQLRKNLDVLYGIDHVPCDTYMRECLDGLKLNPIYTAINSVIHRMQRAKVLENWKFLDDYYLMSVDGTGFFSSSKIHCSSCLERKGPKDKIIYSHQMLTGAIVHPDMKQVLPIHFEPICKEDGQEKNDCERNALKRYIKGFRSHHPQMKVIMIADGLSSNAPNIRLLKENRIRFILVAKKDDHKYMWKWFWDDAEAEEVRTTQKSVEKYYRFAKNVPLNDSNFDLKVNVIYYEETKNGVKTTWGWVTDLDVNEEMIATLVKAGRARWMIENETFNTLKNQGYHFEHNFGHGNNGLCNFLAGMMLLTFLFDQCLEFTNIEYKNSLKKCGPKYAFWEKIRSVFDTFWVSSWENLYDYILDPPRDLHL